MKRTAGNMIVVFLIASIVLAGTLGFLLHRERNSHADLEQLCFHAAQSANERFSDYQMNGSTFSYEYGVAELVSFYNSYKLLCVETEGSTDTNCLYLNSLIGSLMDSPENATDAAEQLVKMTAMLSESIYDENAYDLAFSIHNQLTN